MTSERNPEGGLMNKYKKKKKMEKEKKEKKMEKAFPLKRNTEPLKIQKK